MMVTIVISGLRSLLDSRPFYPRSFAAGMGSSHSQLGSAAAAPSSLFPSSLHGKVVSVSFKDLQQSRKSNENPQESLKIP